MGIGRRVKGDARFIVELNITRGVHGSALGINLKGVDNK
jgi:hypothetical protein